MRKCCATWAGKRLKRILLLSSFTLSMSSRSSSAWGWVVSPSHLHSPCQPRSISLITPTARHTLRVLSGGSLLPRIQRLHGRLPMWSLHPRAWTTACPPHFQGLPCPAAPAHPAGPRPALVSMHSTRQRAPPRALECQLEPHWAPMRAHITPAWRPGGLGSQVGSRTWEPEAKVRWPGGGQQEHPGPSSWWSDRH